MAKKKAKRAATRSVKKASANAKSARGRSTRKSSPRKSSARKAGARKASSRPAAARRATGQGPARKIAGKAAARTRAKRSKPRTQSSVRAGVKRPVAGARSGGVSDAAVARATGHGWDHWLAVLDAFDAKKNGHKAAVAHLHTEHGVGEWWAQTVTVGYEQKRGLRQLRQKADGFSASASRVIGASVAKVMDAFEDRGLAERWLPRGVVAHKVTRPPTSAGRPTKAGSARMTWTDGSKVLSVWIADKSGRDGAAKTAVQVQHDKLPDAEVCDTMRAMWSERLDALRSMLEAGNGQ